MGYGKDKNTNQQRTSSYCPDQKFLYKSFYFTGKIWYRCILCIGKIFDRVKFSMSGFQRMYQASLPYTYPTSELFTLLPVLPVRHIYAKVLFRHIFSNPATTLNRLTHTYNTRQDLTTSTAVDRPNSTWITKQTPYVVATFYNNLPSNFKEVYHSDDIISLIKDFTTWLASRNTRDVEELFKSPYWEWGHSCTMTYFLCLLYFLYFIICSFFYYYLLVYFIDFFFLSFSSVLDYFIFIFFLLKVCFN